MTDPLSAFFAALPGLASAGAAIASSSDATQRNAQLIEFQKVVIQLQANAASIQVQNASLLRDKVELENEIARLRDWALEKEKYELKEIARGLFVRIDKSFADKLQSAQKFCATCFEKNIKSPLQQQNVEVGRQLSLSCFNCKATIVFSSLH